MPENLGGDGRVETDGAWASEEVPIGQENRQERTVICRPGREQHLLNELPLDWLVRIGQERPNGLLVVDHEAVAADRQP